ncbi:poly(beta-D-mannuronate) O-acetylase, putative [Babesia ovata]|uniref:Poly(Beta-D-mannuronate) O-acetylase, putative n=1 Tax=Babesia ovata TaxID=189622 RepID=A0A2H6KF27_9APIC|nr:poly(beta-D-mannuronate) O-acetylase, putative [Babesia ovata]GBE61574.1 poly(beta-D-mannuronate) O-acetylase, putative [Babesia ovata]
MFCRRLLRWRALSTHARNVVPANVELTAGAYEPPPFDFEAIDAIIQSRAKKTQHESSEVAPSSITTAPSSTKESGIVLNNDEKSLFHWFLRETNAVIFAATALAKKGKLLASEQPSGGTFEKTQGEWLCERIADRLLSYSVDNRIIVLQRSLAGWHHSRQRHWHRLAKTALRSCFINDEFLNAQHAVKICAALSKWRCRDIAEVRQKLNLAILAAEGWNVDNASHVLWSLTHLREFDMSAFDYMNNAVAAALSKPDFDATSLMDDTVHRILNANIVRMSHTGRQHQAMITVLRVLKEQPHAVSHLSPKTMLAVSAVMPLCSEMGITEHIARRLSSSMHLFTHVQAAHVFYNFALVAPSLPSAVVDQLVGALFDFKETLYKTEAAYVPSLTAKLLFTFMTFLRGFDHSFISKCLADLNANLHLLGPFSLVGNLQYIKLYMDSSTGDLTDQQLTSLKNTWSNMVKTDAYGDFVKPLFGKDGQAPLDNLKLWHYGALYRLTKLGYESLMRQIDVFRCGVGTDNVVPAMKDFLLFLVNVSARRELIADRRILNAILILASHLRNMSDGNRRAEEYWEPIKFHLAALGILNIFERECEVSLSNAANSGNNVPTMTAIRLAMTAATGGSADDSLLAWFRSKALGATPAAVEKDAFAVRYVMFICLIHGNSIASLLKKASEQPIMKVLTQSFYAGACGPLFNSRNSTDPVVSEVLEYLNASAQIPIVPIDSSVAHAKLFFTQDAPRLLLPLLPEVALAEMCSQQRQYVDLWDVAAWLQEAKQIDSLCRYLEGVGEARPMNSRTEFSELASKVERPLFDVKRVRCNFNVGPYMCHVGLFGGDDSHIALLFIHILGGGCTADRLAGHIFDAQRRKALEVLGVQYIELVKSTD